MATHTSTSLSIPFQNSNSITPAVLPDVKPLLRRPVVEVATGKSRATLYRDIAKGLFVKPVDIGGQRVAWPAQEVAAINQARIAGKSDEEIRKLVAELEAARIVATKG